MRGHHAGGHGAQPPTSQGNPQPHHNRWFLNPYNFVRFLSEPVTRGPARLLGRAAPPPHDRYLGLNGRITCRVTAETPVFVADTEGVAESGADREQHFRYRFFRYGDREAIPSSTLRGVVRSVFEAVTNSCFSVFEFDGFGRLEYREGRDPRLTPARVVVVDEQGNGQLELLDCRVGAPPASGCGSGQGVLSAGLIRAYSPKVGSDPEHVQYLLPPEHQCPDGTRVAALIKLALRPHFREGQVNYRYFEVVRLVAADKRQSLGQAPAGHEIRYGYLHRTGPNIDRKHDERVFFRWDDDTEPRKPGIESIPPAVLVRFDDKVRREYDRHIRAYVERREGKESPSAAWPKPSSFVSAGHELRPGSLVYCKVENGQATLLRPVSLPRLPHPSAREALLPEHLHPCGKADALCPACRVFGWVHGSPDPKDKKAQVAYAGRLRFSHGRLVSDADKEPLQDIILAILGAPKPTTTFFYLAKAGGQPPFGHRTVQYQKGAYQLRGRKFYYHHFRGLRESEYRAQGANRLNRTISGAREAGTVFEFSIDFHNLAPLELGALLWSLEMDGKCVHRLGLGKPLGFGSVRMEVTEMRLLGLARRYAELSDDGGETVLAGDPLRVAASRYVKVYTDAMQAAYGRPFAELENVRDLAAILGREARGRPHVHYPRPPLDPQAWTDAPLPEGRNFEWFVGNKKRPQPYVLPLAEEDKGLPLITRDGDD